MRKMLLKKVQENRALDAKEPIDAISADLAYELQSKMFDQMATVGVAGAGLAVTLIGSTLRDPSREIWLSVVLFVLAAMTAISGNQKLIDRLAMRQACLRRGKRDAMIAVTFVGMAIGWLSMSVYAQSAPQRPPTAGAPVTTG